MYRINHYVKFLIFPALFVFSFSAYAQRDFSKVEIKTIKLTDNIYMLQGSGGNIGLCIGDDGVLMIDDQFAPLSDKILAAVKKLSDKELGYLVNTHFHGDHTGGNENFAAAGATIVAHQNVRKRLSTEQVRGDRTTPPRPKSAWPVITFSEDMSLHVNGEDIMIHHVHNAHTDGDAILYFTTSNVMHLGDTFFNGRYPFIDIGSGGSINGIIAAADKAIFLADDDTKIIPGHGELASRADLIEYREVLISMRDRVKAAMDEGQSIDQILAAKLGADRDEEWGSGFINGERFVRFIFTSLDD